MANTAYGRGAYGAHRYGGWPGGAGRPYGIGPYGSGAYSRYSANAYDMGGATGLVFSLHAPPHLTMQFHAPSGIVFNATMLAPQLTFNVSAVSGIVFSLAADVEWSWPTWTPCKPGGWQAAGPCEAGGWQPATHWHCKQGIGVRRGWRNSAYNERQQLYDNPELRTVFASS